MRTPVRPILFGLVLLLPLRAAESLDEVLKRGTLDRTQRLETAAAELSAVRERIAREKAPLLDALRAVEDRVVVADAGVDRLTTDHERYDNDRRRLLKDLEASRKNVAYVSTLGQDSVKAFRDGLGSAEGARWRQRLDALQAKMDDPNSPPSALLVVDAAEILLDHVEQVRGGHRGPGEAMIAGGNEIVKGTFAFVGPETFFLPGRGGAAGVVRSRPGARYPTSYALAAWTPADAAAFFAGQPATILVDPSGGKALQLQQTSGTVWEHVRKGGVVAMAIIVVGLAALVMIVQKVIDLARMAADSPAAVQGFLGTLANGSRAEAEAALGGLRSMTRELFTVGLKHLDEPKTVLEERLQAVLLGQRLHFERRLPLLAVIATAAPLMGLLGTVVGMVKTFALITVFGTGNAGKLSSGISEVLVATEIGLTVAIPTLVAHGFLAHRIHKNLAILERQALEFATTAELAKLQRGTARASEGVGP